MTRLEECIISDAKVAIIDMKLEVACFGRRSYQGVLREARVETRRGLRIRQWLPGRPVHSPEPEGSVNRIWEKGSLTRRCHQMTPKTGDSVLT